MVEFFSSLSPHEKFLGSMYLALIFIYGIGFVATRNAKNFRAKERFKTFGLVLLCIAVWSTLVTGITNTVANS